MARTVVLTCDKCSSDQNVDTYRIGRSTATPYEVDLCGRCAEPVASLMEIGRLRVAGWGAAAATSASREPELRTKVHTPEELDRLEQEYRKKQAKKK